MPQPETVIVDTINLKLGLATTEDGDVGDIRMLLDADGDVTTDLQLAATAIVEWRRLGKFSPVVLGDFEFRLIN
jgi:hypothetical protein